MSAACFIVSGQVQGVIFRACTREQARALGLRGSARNLADGGVKVIAVGDPAAIDALDAWLHSGPPAARVDTLLRLPAHDGDANDAGFTIG